MQSGAQRQYFAVLMVVVIYTALVSAPSPAFAGYGQGDYYSQAYYQAYYQSYYQSYYQPYYQSGYGITFTSDVAVTGSTYITGALVKGSGTFLIDHPLDPKNMLLYHSFVESPDAKNIYDGIAILDEDGAATIALPDYFLPLNKHFRYLATGTSGPMPDLHLVRGVRREWFFGAPTFRVAGGVPNGTISWQVTGIRQDPLILANPIIPEVEKGPDQPVEKGECIFEPLCE